MLLRCYIYNHHRTSTHLIFKISTFGSQINGGPYKRGVKHKVKSNKQGGEIGISGAGGEVEISIKLKEKSLFVNEVQF